jgi:hypothetical protein
MVIENIANTNNKFLMLGCGTIFLIVLKSDGNSITPIVPLPSTQEASILLQ